MHLLLQAIRFVTSRIVLKIFLFLTVGMLFAAINLVNPNDLDPFGLAAPLGIDISEAQYDAGDKAALGAILTAILLANALFLKRKDGEGPEAVELVDWLLGFETLSIAITVGWNWLLWETQSSPGPQLLAVLSVVLQLVLLILFVVAAVALWTGVPASIRVLWRWLRDRTRRK